MRLELLNKYNNFLKIKQNLANYFICLEVKKKREICEIEIAKIDQSLIKQYKKRLTIQMKQRDLKIEQLQQKLEQAEKDNQSLSQSFQEVSECYTMKISILEETIEGYQSRIEELLLWKKNYIDKQLFDTAKYEEENQKLLGIIDQLYVRFEEEMAHLQAESEKKDQLIQELTEEKAQLLKKSEINQQKTEELVKVHMREIEQLKFDLAELSEQIAHNDSSISAANDAEILDEQNEEEKAETEVEGSALREIMNVENSLNECEETRVKVAKILPRPQTKENN